ncbi:MAG: DUF4329 domain-containing protein [Oscillospiraceae bacterium]|nr:DUF4329 domain-containing protein [Oscillospiraceae bacterium]
MGRYENDTPANPLGYCGEYRDAETGFIYLRARYYDPNLGRFTTEDPARDGLNWYVYCNNNPINYVDPWGLAPGDWFTTEEDAAKDFAKIYNPISIKENAEYGAYIYCFYAFTEEKGKVIVKLRYSYAEPVKGQEKSINTANFTPVDTEKHKIVAIIHTHGASDPNLSTENFSGDDIMATKQLGLNRVYLATPNGYLKVYDLNKTSNNARVIGKISSKNENSKIPWWKKLFKKIKEASK